MDHPGFHGKSWTSEGKLEIRWLGGSPTAHLEGASVWLSDRKGWRGHGTLVDAKMHASGRMLESGTVRLLSQDGADTRKTFPKGTELFGGFGFRAPAWQEGELIYTKAADDLVGSFAIVSLALDLLGSKGKKKSKSAGAVTFLGLLTRAEEVGFIGAIGHFEQGWLKRAKRPVLCVSLETSRTLPGAEFGKGPVVRLGDRFTVFEPGALRVFTDLAEKALPGRHQRRIMDGGTCEASAATVFGIPAIGISIPLGNYHNQSFEGGPDSRGPLGPAPEFVHLGDVAGLVELCHALLKPGLAWREPWAGKMTLFKKSLRGYGSLLRSSP